MKIEICLLSLVLLASVPAGATLYSSSTPVAIPDFNPIGTSSSLQFFVSGESLSLSALTLTFALQGGVSTELSGYLRLGDTMGSPSYNLTTLIQGQSLNPSSATTYTIDFSTSSFSTVFNGLNPNDTWTLFFADTVNGDTTTVNGWSLNVNPVPEPVNVALGVFGVVLVGTVGIRRFKQHRKVIAP